MLTITWLLYALLRLSVLCLELFRQAELEAPELTSPVRAITFPGIKMDLTRVLHNAGLDVGAEGDKALLVPFVANRVTSLELFTASVPGKTSKYG